MSKRGTVGPAGRSCSKCLQMEPLRQSATQGCQQTRRFAQWIHSMAPSAHDCARGPRCPCHRRRPCLPHPRHHDGPSCPPCPFSCPADQPGLLARSHRYQHRRRGSAVASAPLVALRRPTTMPLQPWPQVPTRPQPASIVPVTSLCRQPEAAQCHQETLRRSLAHRQPHAPRLPRPRHPRPPTLRRQPGSRACQSWLPPGGRPVTSQRPPTWLRQLGPPGRLEGPPMAGA
mmetsp:Transcript_24624/g.65473  ORF Transcript_24624/g.65473 Transcript_24624/m.65473 type:complete len:230 (+) Transcript_24624:1024-1713(+)